MIFGQILTSYFIIRSNSELISLQNFGRGEISSFLMKCPEEIGTPLSLHIWHDNSGGKSAAWYLGKVVFIDLQHKRWFATAYCPLFLFPGTLHHNVVLKPEYVEIKLPVLFGDDYKFPNRWLIQGGPKM